MIARLWSAQTTEAQAPGYAEHLARHVLPSVRSLSGYAGTMLLKRSTGEAVELIVITLWKSVESIREFAGSLDPERAVVADQAAQLLTRFDRRVRHYELLVKDEAPGVWPAPLNP